MYLFQVSMMKSRNETPWTSAEIKKKFGHLSKQNQTVLSLMITRGHQEEAIQLIDERRAYTEDGKLMRLLSDKLSDSPFENWICSVLNPTEHELQEAMKDLKRIGSKLETFHVAQGKTQQRFDFSDDTLINSLNMEMATILEAYRSSRPDIDSLFKLAIECVQVTANQKRSKLNDLEKQINTSTSDVTVMKVIYSKICTINRFTSLQSIYNEDLQNNHNYSLKGLYTCFAFVIEFFINFFKKVGKFVEVQLDEFTSGVADLCEEVTQYATDLLNPSSSQLEKAIQKARNTAAEQELSIIELRILNQLEFANAVLHKNWYDVCSMKEKLCPTVTGVWSHDPNADFNDEFKKLIKTTKNEDKTHTPYNAMHSVYELVQLIKKARQDSNDVRQLENHLQSIQFPSEHARPLGDFEPNKAHFDAIKTLMPKFDDTIKYGNKNLSERITQLKEAHCTEQTAPNLTYFDGFIAEHWHEDTNEISYSASSNSSLSPW